MSELGAMRNYLADLIEAHGPEEWSPAFVSALTALFELHFAEGGTNKAPVLELVRR
jgi:hypothetical protein